MRLSVSQYRDLISQDKDIPPGMVERMVKNYAIARQRHKAYLIKERKMLKVRRAQEELREMLKKKYGYADEEYIMFKIGNESFNPFTDDPSCKNCRKRKTGPVQ